jgi:uncharacterized Zn-binding protein involved in type VI secretion
MRVALVRHGDTTTTGGFVMAFKSGMHDHGKKIAISGDRSTCGNCKGDYPIHGTGKGISNRGLLSVVDGDAVLCPCGKNRVIASMNAGCHLERKTEAATGSAANSRSAAAPSVGMAFDEQIRSVATGAALDGYPYFIATADDRTSCGRIAADGRLPRIATESADDYTVHWGDDALARQEQST